MPVKLSQTRDADRTKLRGCIAKLQQAESRTQPSAVDIATVMIGLPPLAIDTTSVFYDTSRRV